MGATPRAIIPGICIPQRGNRSKNVRETVKPVRVANKKRIRGRKNRPRFSIARHIIYINGNKIIYINGNKSEKNFFKKVKKIKKTFQKCLTLSFVNGIMFKLSFKTGVFFGGKNLSVERERED